MAQVTSGLGWPDHDHSPTVSGLGWPEVEDDRQGEARPPAPTVAQEGTGVSADGLTGPDLPRSIGLPRIAGDHPPVTSAHVAAAPAVETPRPDPTPLATAVRNKVMARSRLPRTLPAPDHTRVLVVANQKGGVGKTTTAVNLAAALAQHSLRVLIVDLDPQGNASTALSVEHPEGTPSVYDVIADGTAMAAVVHECAEAPGLFCVPATIDLAGAEIELVSQVARESRLRRALDTYLEESSAGGQRYDYVFVDCPPSLGLLTINALVAGRELLIPIQCEYYALEGVTQLLRNIDLVRSHLNPDLVVSTVLLTMYDARTRLAAQVADEVRAHFGAAVLPTAIPRSVRISEAPSYGQSVMRYDPGSAGALSYLEAARELATKGGTLNGHTVSMEV